VPATGGSALDFFKKQRGPLPTWGWCAVGIGTVVGGYLFLKWKKV